MNETKEHNPMVAYHYNGTTWRETWDGITWRETIFGDF